MTQYATLQVNDSTVRMRDIDEKKQQHTLYHRDIN